MLTVYTENVAVVKHPKLCEIDLESVCPALVVFKAHCRDKVLQAGHRKQQNYFLKAAKWSHKVFAMQHALDNSTNRYVVWLDADTYTTAQIPDAWAEQVLQGACFSAHSERIRHGQHIESGLVIFDRDHPDIPTIQKFLARPYVTPYDIFNLTKPWDSFWLWELSQKVAFHDLNSGRIFGHPMVKPYLTHDVGKRKYKQAGINPYTLNKNSTAC